MQTITAGQLADKLNVSRQTMEKRVRRTFPDISPALSAPLSADQIAVLSAGRVGKSVRKKYKQRNEKTMAATGAARVDELAPMPENKKAEPARKARLDISAVRRFAFDTVCILIVVGHAALIWYDCAQMWAAPGVIGGGLAFLFVLGAVLLATDPTRQRTSGYALAFMFVVDVAAFFVHFPTFLKYAEIGEIQTGALCGFICLLSFAALYLYQDSKLD